MELMYSLLVRYHHIANFKDVFMLQIDPFKLINYVILIEFIYLKNMSGRNSLHNYKCT